jgi:hypothetical protein
MEELGMAYRENITLKDLELCRRVLNTVAAPKDRGISPRNGFEIADACVSVLQDIRLRFLELHPELSAYRAWGPGYFRWSDDDQNRYHAFGWDLYKRKWAEARFGCRIWLPENPRLALSCSLHFDGSRIKGKFEERPIKSMFSTGGTFKQDVLLSWLNRCAKRWKLI